VWGEGGGGGLKLALKELCFKFTFNNSIFVIVEYFFYFQGAFVSIMFCFLNGEVSVFCFLLIIIKQCIPGVIYVI
jgi:hypothetical protein